MPQKFQVLHFFFKSSSMPPNLPLRIRNFLKNCVFILFGAYFTMRAESPISLKQPCFHFYCITKKNSQKRKQQLCQIERFNKIVKKKVSMGFKFYIQGGPSNIMDYFVKFQQPFSLPIWIIWGRRDQRSSQIPQLSMRHSTIIQLHQKTKRKWPTTCLNSSCNISKSKP